MKSEIRNPKSERSPESEIRRIPVACDFSVNVPRRPLFRVSDFGFRISDLCGRQVSIRRCLLVLPLVSAFIAVLPVGCAHGPGREEREFMRIYTPQVPVFLSGPASALLTNTEGFSARATVRGDSAFPGSEFVEGELLGRGSKLVFAPGKTEPENKQLRLGAFSYIWDVASGTGFLLSEALQGYAPVASTLRVTNLVYESGGSPPREVTAFMNDGSKTVFRVWPGDTRKEFPSRIEARGTLPLTVSLAKIRLQSPPADLFVPPDSFSKYPTADALADEIAVRQHNLGRGLREPAVPSMPEHK
jgi:hypothetical protein